MYVWKDRFDPQKTCRYMVIRKEGLATHWTYGYLCGKPTAPNLAPGTRFYEAGACVEHLNAPPLAESLATYRRRVSEG